MLGRPEVLSVPLATKKRSLRIVNKNILLSRARGHDRIAFGLRKHDVDYVLSSVHAASFHRLGQAPSRSRPRRGATETDEVVRRNATKQRIVT